MNKAEIESMIAETKKQMEEISGEIDQLFLEFERTMPNFLHAWSEEEFRNSIATNNKTVIEMPENVRKEMKEEFSSYLDSIPSLITDLFRNQQEWPHHSQTYFYSHSDQSIKSIDIIQKYLREAVKPLGNILKKHKLTNYTSGGAWMLYSEEGNVISRWYIFPFPSESKYREYSTLFGRYSVMAKKLSDLNDELKKRTALDLFDQA